MSIQWRSPRVSSTRLLVLIFLLITSSVERRPVLLLLIKDTSHILCRRVKRKTLSRRFTRAALFYPLSSTESTKNNFGLIYPMSSFALFFFLCVIHWQNVAFLSSLVHKRSIFVACIAILRRRHSQEKESRFTFIRRILFRARRPLGHRS